MQDWDKGFIVGQTVERLTNTERRLNKLELQVQDIQAHLDTQGDAMSIETPIGALPLPLALALFFGVLAIKPDIIPKLFGH